MALASVLLATVVLAIVIAGIFFASTQEYRIGRNLIEQEQARADAESGLAALLEAWSPDIIESLPVGASLEQTFEIHEGATIATVLTRLTTSAFWATARVETGVRGAEAVRTFGATIQLSLPDLRPLAPLVIGSAPAADATPLIPSSVRVDGTDAAPPGWEGCGVAGPPIPALVVADTQRLAAPGTCSDGCLAGELPFLVDPTLGDTTRASVFDADAWQSLTSNAGIVLAGGTVVGIAERPLGPRVENDRCDTTIDSNWGDPLRTTPCAGYFPIVHVLGDLVIAGGSGQGTLLVEGDLTMTGGASFTGVVLVRGAFRTGDGGAHLFGVVRVGERSGVASALHEGTTLTFSRCAVLAALVPAAPPVILPRSWIELRR